MATEDITPRWLTRKGAKAYCGLSVPTLDRRMREKAFVTKKVGTTRLIDRISLDAWIERNGKSEPVAPA